MNLPLDVKDIIDKLNAGGYEAYAVGGCVRDSILGYEPSDWDVCTNANPEQIQDVFKDSKLLLIGLKHGTVTVEKKGLFYEVTTYRIDGEYENRRHPKSVEFVKSLQSDLSRRDFTINAMAYHHKDGLIDCYHGKKDLENKLIRCVGDANIRFNEDALRIMRALRFSAVYGFDIEKNTKINIHRNKELLSQISVHRINTEFSKLICAANAKKVLLEFYDVIIVIIPEIAPMINFTQHCKHHKHDVWEHSAQAVSNIVPQIVLRLAMLLHDIGKPACFTIDETEEGHFKGHAQLSAKIAEDVLKRMEFSSDIIKQTTQLIYNHINEIKVENVKRWLGKIGEVRLRQLLLVKMADAASKGNALENSKALEFENISSCIEQMKKECFSLKNLDINGYDLISIGVKQGEKIGEILKQLLLLVMEDDLENKKEILIKYVMTQIHHPFVV